MASFNESGQKFILTVKSGEGEKECEATYITRISDGEREFIYYFIQEDGDNVGIYASRIDLIDVKKVMRDILMMRKENIQLSYLLKHIKA